MSIIIFLFYNILFLYEKMPSWIAVKSTVRFTHSFYWQLIQKMKITTPEPKIVNGYLSEIARSFNVIWEDATDDFAVRKLPLLFGFPIPLCIYLCSL